MSHHRSRRRRLSTCRSQSAVNGPQARPPLCAVCALHRSTSRRFSNLTHVLASFLHGPRKRVLPVAFL
eukprot:2207545-Pleurochrysis_carterae.AAC.1